MSVRIHQLSKIYGTQKAVDAISFEAKKGEVLGFLGPNGAGKSTTMKIATGYLPPSQGTVELCGIDVMKDSVKARKKVGYLPEHNPLYLEMYVHEYLHFMAGLSGIKGKEAKERVKEMVELCGLSREQHKKIGALSKGYRQRVGLAQALLHDPEVLILDEPTTGLDPNQLVDIRQLIKTISKDKTVILSTHIMQEVKAICDRVVIINQGKLVANDLLANMTANKTTLKVEFQHEVDTRALKTFGTVSKNGQVYHITTNSKKDLRPQLFELAKQNNWTILSLSQEQQDLEEIFHQLTQAK